MEATNSVVRLANGVVSHLVCPDCKRDVSLDAWDYGHNLCSVCVSFYNSLLEPEAPVHPCAGCPLLGGVCVYGCENSEVHEMVEIDEYAEVMGS